MAPLDRFVSLLTTICMISSSNFRTAFVCSAVFLCVLGMLIAMEPGVAQIKENPKKGTPVKFELLVPQLDLSVPENKKQLEGQVSDSFNPEVLEIPRSGSTKAYEIGLKLFEQGDYRRAMNAFQLALIRANEFGKSDPRFAAAQKAIDSTKPHLTMRSKIGYDTDNKDAKALSGKVQ